MTKRRKPTVARYLVKSSLVLLIGLTASGLCLARLARPVDQSAKETREFEVARGKSTLQIAKDLEGAQLIRSKQIFRLVVKLEGLAGKLQAGIYQLSPSWTTREMVLALTKGNAKEQKLTIPEGYRLEQIAELAGKSLGISQADFMDEAKGWEGHLFPDTYLIAEGTTAQELVSILRTNFSKKVSQVSEHDLILASLVERETKGGDEKRVVAGILKKRLAAGWPLELDATVQYSLGKTGNWWPTTTILDRKLPSPYNTYLHPGLPPTPIGNPGLLSIQAVQSSNDSPYWFYLHDKSGQIHYAATSAEHNQNIRTYIR